MADFKFACPECQQRIAVDETAAGIKIDCPLCKSVLIIPSNANERPKTVLRRKLVFASSAADNVFEEIEGKQRELEKALAESTRLREESERSERELQKLRDDLAATASERDGLRSHTEQAGAELDRLKTEENRFKTELDQTREALSEAERKRAELERELAAKARTLEAQVRMLGDVRTEQESLVKLRNELTTATSERDAARAETEKAKNDLRRMAMGIEEAGGVGASKPKLAAMEKQ